MNLPPKISIVVPCYNAADFLAATIASVLAQHFKEWELILVDDGSTDGTWNIIQNHEESDVRIRGCQKANAGTTRARNFGFALTNPAAPYLFFLDHDDQLEPSALAKLSSYLKAEPDVGLLVCGIQDMDASGRPLGTGRKDRWAKGICFPRRLGDDEVQTPFETFFCATGQGPFAIYRRSVYLRTEGWETAFWPHEDTDMFCQMALLANVHYMPDRLYLKRIHPAQGMNSGRVQDAYANFRLKWDNRMPRNAAEAVMLVRAKKYYYSMHQPCRSLKVAMKALRHFLVQPSWAAWQWFVRQLYSGFFGLMSGYFKK